MQIIDIHTHVYPDKVAKKASDSIRDFYDIYGGQMDGTVEMLLERGKEAGISKYVILPVSNAANRVRSINNFILEQTAAHDCFIGFGTLHADMENLEEEAFSFGIGYHPAYTIPFDDQHTIADYELRFSDMESPICLEAPTGLLNGKY